MSLGEFGGVVGTAVKMGNVNLHHVVATFTDNAGAFTQDLALSSPGAVLTRTGAGKFSVQLPSPRQQVILPLTQSLSAAETLAGQFVDFETLNISTGVVTYETATVKGTALDPVSGNVLRIYILTAGF